MENSKFTTIGIKVVDPRTDDDNLIIKEMGNSRSDYMEQIHAQSEKIIDIIASMQLMEQIHAQFEKIIDIIASMQLHPPTQERTEGNGSRYDFCVEVTKSQYQIVAAITQAATNPTSLTNLEPSLPNDLPPLVCSHENKIEECCFVETPLPTPFPSQPPKRSHSLLASEHEIEDKSGYSHDVSAFMEKNEVDIAKISSGISSNSLSAIVEREVVLNPFPKETSSETMKLLENVWVPIGVYCVFNDPTVQNYLFLNKCFEVCKVKGGLNFNFKYRRKKKWSCEWRAEWLKLTEKLKEQFANGWKNSQDGPLFSSVVLDVNSVVSLTFRMKLLLDFLVTEVTFYDGSLYLVTTDWNGAIHGLPIVHNFNQESFGFRNSSLHGMPLIVKIFFQDQKMNVVCNFHACRGVSLADHFVGPGMICLHHSFLLQHIRIVIIFFKANSPASLLCNVPKNWVNELSNCASIIGLSASKALPTWRIKLSFESQFSFFNMFYVFTAGSFDVEVSIQTAGPILVFKGLLGYSFTWSVGGALVEVGIMFLEKGSYVVGKCMIWDQIWFCGNSCSKYSRVICWSILGRNEGVCSSWIRNVKVEKPNWCFENRLAKVIELPKRAAVKSKVKHDDALEVVVDQLERANCVVGEVLEYEIGNICGILAITNFILLLEDDFLVAIILETDGCMDSCLLQLSRGDTTLSRREYCHVHNYGGIGNKAR